MGRVGGKIVTERTHLVEVRELGSQNRRFAQPRVMERFDDGFQKIKASYFCLVVCGFELWYTF